MRPSNVVMKLKRLGSMHQSRLSFMRILLRHLKDHNWSFKRSRFELGENGEGYAIYTAFGSRHNYSLVVFSHDLPDEKRSDRVIAESWDATFTLFDGIPSDIDIKRLRKNVPFQENGRVTEKEITLSRANRSIRLFNHVVESLSTGCQPDLNELRRVGYLMRTTAVYGSGKFGAADREHIQTRPEFSAPFQAEMLTVYLLRWFTIDLVEFLAYAKNPRDSVKLSKSLAVNLGIGNATGLGMAPFLLNHPALFNQWISCKESALESICGIKKIAKSQIELFKQVFARSEMDLLDWTTSDRVTSEKIEGLISDVNTLKQHLICFDWQQPYPWRSIVNWVAMKLSIEIQEWLNSLILEPYPFLVDDYSHKMSVHNEERKYIDGDMTVKEILDLIDQFYYWALDIDWQSESSEKYLWYVSEEKLEPRLAERHSESLTDYEYPFAPGKDIFFLKNTLKKFGSQCCIGDFLMLHPEFRHVVRRLQLLPDAPYAEIYDNTVSSELRPVDMLRCKLSFFGATHFDPKSDRWVRICMFKHAPLPKDLKRSDSDLWVYPELA